MDYFKFMSNLSNRKTYLTQVHDDRLVDLLPQMGPEDLDKGDL